ncbi:hypothetical protein Csa_023695, partial [Cucumis sativus]
FARLNRVINLHQNKEEHQLKTMDQVRDHEGMENEEISTLVPMKRKVASTSTQPAKKLKDDGTKDSYSGKFPHCRKVTQWPPHEDSLLPPHNPKEQSLSPPYKDKTPSLLKNIKLLPS